MVATMYYHNCQHQTVSHVGKTYLHAVVTVSKVLHWLELLVDDTNASLMSAVYNTLNIFGTLAHCLQLLVQALGGLDGGLRVELGWTGSVS
jgi:hypothetical protein